MKMDYRRRIKMVGLVVALMLLGGAIVGCVVDTGDEPAEHLEPDSSVISWWSVGLFSEHLLPSTCGFVYELRDGCLVLVPEVGSTHGYGLLVPVFPYTHRPVLLEADQEPTGRGRAIRLGRSACVGHIHRTTVAQWRELAGNEVYIPEACDPTWPTVRL